MVFVTYSRLFYNQAGLTMCLWFSTFFSSAGFECFATGKRHGFNGCRVVVRRSTHLLLQFPLLRIALRSQEYSREGVTVSSLVDLALGMEVEGPRNRGARAVGSIGEKFMRTPINAS